MIQSLYKKIKSIAVTAFLVIGISPLAEAEENKTSTTSTKTVQSAQTTAPNTSSNFYNGLWTITAAYGSKGNSYSGVDLWLPLWQKADRVWFMDLRANKDESIFWETNIGSGFRWLSPEQQYLYGLYFFYDDRNSQDQNLFQQLTLGAEIKTERWSLTGNYYQPIFKNKFYEASLDQTTFAAYGNNQMLLVGNGYEKSLGGYDLELGRTLFSGLKLYTAYYYFGFDAEDTTIEGHRISLDYQLSALPSSSAWMQNLSVQTSWQHDDVRGDVWTLGMQLRLPYGNNKTPTYTANSLQSQMSDVVRRDLNVVTVEDNEEYAPFETNGHVAKFGFANSADDLSTMTQQSDLDVIVLNNNIAIGNTDSISLQNNITLTGQYYEYKPGVYVNATGQNSPYTLTVTTPDNGGAPVFVAGQNTTIRDMNIDFVFPENVTTPNAIAIGSNTDGNLGSFFTATNINTNGGIQLTQSTGTTNIDISNNKFNRGDVADSNNPVAGIYITATGTANPTITANNNTITFAIPYENNTSTYQAPSNQAGIFITSNNYNGVINNITAENNVISFVGGSANQGIGIYMTEGVIKNGNISDNQITLTDSMISQGISIQQRAATNVVESLTLDAIDNNTIHFAQSDIVGLTTIGKTGIYISNIVDNGDDSTQHIGSISDNIIVIDVTSSDNNDPANFGIHTVVNSAHQTIDKMSSNVIHFPLGDHDTGISIENTGHGGVQTINEFTGNTVYFFPASSGVLAGTDTHIINIIVHIDKGIDPNLTTIKKFNSNGVGLGSAWPTVGLTVDIGTLDNLAIFTDETKIRETGLNSLIYWNKRTMNYSVNGVVGADTPLNIEVFNNPVI